MGLRCIPGTLKQRPWRSSSGTSLWGPPWQQLSIVASPDEKRRKARHVCVCVEPYLAYSSNQMLHTNSQTRPVHNPTGPDWSLRRDWFGSTDTSIFGFRSLGASGGPFSNGSRRRAELMRTPRRVKHTFHLTPTIRPMDHHGYYGLIAG